MPRVRYDPPPLDRKVLIRDPEQAPNPETVPRGTDGVRDYSGEPEWGFKVWANRRDQGQFVEISEGVQTVVGRSVFTIHHRPGVKPTFEVFDSDDAAFVMVGPAVERGGANAGMVARYLELHCERRTAKGTA